MTPLSTGRFAATFPIASPRHLIHISVILLLFAVALATPLYARCTAQLVSGPVKIRPYATLPVPHTAPLVCARNSYCSFQVVITADREDCRGANVETPKFESGDYFIPAQNVAIYRQDFVNVFYRSSEQGDLGEWPDPLIPKIDPDYNEPRNAFPVDVARVSRAYKMYAQRDGRALGETRGPGQVIAQGNYTGGLAVRYVIQITRGGSVGQAAFRWYSQPGPVNRSPELTASAQPVSLERGVNIAFSGADAESDFAPGDEFWIFAGPSRHQPVWVDVLIPAGPAATYSADVRVSFANAPAITLPVQIEVVNYTLPGTPALASSFGIYWPGVYAEHFPGGRDEERAQQLAEAYTQAALRNGVTLGGSGDFLPQFTFRTDGTLERADYTSFDRAHARWLDGPGTKTSTPLGARATSLRIPAFNNLTEPQRRTAIADFVRHAGERGWGDRLFDYLADEPRTPQQFDALRKRAAVLKDLMPSVPRLATIQLRDDLIGVVTRWCPIINFFEPDYSGLRAWWRNRNRPTPANYAARLRAGDSLWLYQSCMSHGCGGTGRSPQSDNWPSYMLDASAGANRVFGLMSGSTYHASGVLYWDVAYAYHHDAGRSLRALNPWESIYYFGGNGDGTLFYPGTPEKIGGTRHIAVESLRLKFIRDSFVDATLARAWREHDGAAAERETRRLVQSARRWNSDPAAWTAFRERALRRLAAK